MCLISFYFQKPALFCAAVMECTSADNASVIPAGKESNVTSRRTSALCQIVMVMVSVSMANVNVTRASKGLTVEAVSRGRCRSRDPSAFCCYSLQ